MPDVPIVPARSGYCWISRPTQHTPLETGRAASKHPTALHRHHGYEENTLTDREMPAVPMKPTVDHASQATAPVTINQRAFSLRSEKNPELCDLSDAVPRRRRVPISPQLPASRPARCPNHIRKHFAFGRVKRVPKWQDRDEPLIARRQPSNHPKAHQRRSNAGRRGPATENSRPRRQHRTVEA